MTLRHTVLGLCALSSVACYSYVPVGGARLAPGRRVAIDLTVRGQADYESKLGSGVDRVEGVLANYTPDSAQVQVERTRTRNGAWTYWEGEAVVLPVSTFAKIGERRLSIPRTSIAVASVAAVAVEMLTGSLIGIGGHDRDPNPRPIPPVQPGLRR
ncbi:MAG: hypothetical protein ACRENU_15935 [Gemmatimonadaceae bacterium]